MERPIVYLSQALNEHELKFGISDKEGCAATWAIRKMRPWLVSNQVVLITDHSSLVALTGGKDMKNMRQQRYAMDLSEFNLTIVHGAGALLHTADALPRRGHLKRHADSMVEQIRHRPVQQCTVEKLKPAFKEVQEGAWLKARIAAVETGIPQSMTETYQRLELNKVMAKHMVESEVEMYDMVAAVRTMSRKSGRLAVQLTAGQVPEGTPEEEVRITAEEVKDRRKEKEKHAQNSTEKENSRTDQKDTGEGRGRETDKTKEQEKSKEKGAQNSAWKEIKIHVVPIAAREGEKAEQAEQSVVERSAQPEIVRLEMKQIVQAQDKQPMMLAVKAYIRDGNMPRGKLTRIRALEQAQMTVRGEPGRGAVQG